MLDTPAMADGARAFAHAWRGDRRLAAALIGDGPAAAAIADPRGVAVVAGQQPAVGGGPLYTLLKAVQSVAVARRLQQAGVPAAGLFWCASDDHDLEEADHADLVRRDARLARFRADLGPQRRALRHVPAAPWWPGLLAWCGEHLGPGPGAAWILAHAPRDGEGMGAWECRLLADLVPGLHAVEAWRLRPGWHDALGRALAAWPARELAACRQALVATGSDPLGALPAPPLFLDRPDARIALDPEAARGQFARDSLLLSPGAALRPVLQQAVLPAALVVLGPGERAYHRAIPPLYRALDLPEPLRLPRLSRTLAPSWLPRACAAHGLAVEEVLAGRWPAPAGPALGELDAAIDRLALRHPAQRDALARLRRDRDRLAAALIRGAVARPSPAQLHDWLRPRGLAQERVMSLLQAVWEHGPGIVRALDGDGDPVPALIRL